VISVETSLTIDALTAGDWPAVSAIYAEGIETRNATFETEVPSWEEWDAAHLGAHRLVARRDGIVVAWAALSPVSGRCVYRGVAESSIYVGFDARGQGVGRTLLSALVESAEAGGIWTIEAGVFPENHESLRLHAACGFRVVGVRERIGKLDGVWLDVVFLERRSKELT
jgi:L-amino acid N-acyltransferase YncA